MQLISFFSGIGGFEIAARQMGWDNVFSCEINPFGQKVLKYHFPEAYHHDDIKTFNIETLKKSRWNHSADSIVCGGFPCQPYSAAGKRLGKEDDRHLWPEMLRAIREIQPTWVVGENVRGLTNWNGGMVFDEVQADLEAAGYEVTPFLLPACAVNAPHRRDRIWFIAYANVNGRPNVSGNIFGKGESKQNEGAEQQQRVINKCEIGNVTNPRSQQLQERTQDSITEDRKEDRSGMDNRAKRQGNVGDATHAGNVESQGSELNRGIKSKGPIQEHGRQFSGSVCGKWENFPTQPPICSGNDEFSSRLVGITFSKHRNESIKALGNAVVPAVVLQIFKAIEAMTKIQL